MLQPSKLGTCLMELLMMQGRIAAGRPLVALGGFRALLSHAYILIVIISHGSAPRLVPAWLRPVMALAIRLRGTYSNLLLATAMVLQLPHAGGRCIALCWIK